jgi:hypothetical protein
MIKKLMILLIVVGSIQSVYANNNPAIDIDIIAKIESNWNADANSFAGAKHGRGVCQISEIALRDWNKLNPRDKYKIKDLYNQASLQGINLDLTANQQGFNQEQAKAGLYNLAMGQNFGQGMTAQGTQYNQGLGTAQFKNTAQQQQLAQDLALRAQPINEVIGLMGGSQIQLPQFQGYQGAQVAPAPTFAGTQAQGQADLSRYGIQQAGNNATTSGLFGALTSAAMLASKFSDRRLKSNIVQVGTHPLGIGIYEYDIFGNRERGVMADEVAKVMPDAIIPHSSGYMMVNYGKL